MKKVINDPDQCIEKWGPLTEGLDKRTQGLCSWVMEQEAKHLQTLTNSVNGNGTLGPVLKFLFPVMRRTVERVSVLDHIAATSDRVELSRIYQGLVDDACVVVEAVHAERSGSEPDPDSLLCHEVIRSLGSRLADYTLSYPRLY